MYFYAPCLLFAFTVFLAEQAPAKNRNVDILENVPKIGGQVYRCADMVQVVNRLRRLGKEKSLSALRDYLGSDGDPEKVLQVHVICRLLFVNPKGWDPLTSGNLPIIDGAAMKPYPFFPIAMSNGVPFLLVKGYLGGRISANNILKLCERLAMVKEDYPLADYEKAASTLIQTDAFRQLYQAAEREEMAKMILRQAKKAKAPERK